MEQIYPILRKEYQDEKENTYDNFHSLINKINNKLTIRKNKINESLRNYRCKHLSKENKS